MLYLLATLINKKTNLRHKFFQEYKKRKIEEKETVDVHTMAM